MSQTMELSQDALETIGSYVRRHLAAWLQELVPPAWTERELDLRERAVRVEEELKTQRELMRQGFEYVARQFEQVDKRFEQVDKRFEQVDKRLDDMNRHMNRWLTVITVMLGLIGIGVMVSGFVG